MKMCSLCNEPKDIGCFVKQAKAADGLFPWCDDCRRKYRKEKREDNIESARQYTNGKRAARISWFQELKSNTPCVDCGQIYEPYCMDYDHIPERGEKTKSVSRMVIDNTPKEVILSEIVKCDLICLFCHNRRTQARFFEKLGEERKYKPHQQRNINLINDFKSRPCTMCGQQYEHFNMQIDHIDPATKLYDVCDLKTTK
ncbi:MAG: hypothetical protein HC877_23915 [Thioploca sp.]|nr:hypothetical protein [Thioploca sp.]